MLVYADYFCQPESRIWFDSVYPLSGSLVVDSADSLQLDELLVCEKLANVDECLRLRDLAGKRQVFISCVKLGLDLSV